jgi:hypothetical protein
MARTSDKLLQNFAATLSRRHGVTYGVVWPGLYPVFCIVNSNRTISDISGPMKAAELYEFMRGYAAGWDMKG